MKVSATILILKIQNVFTAIQASSQLQNLNVVALKMLTVLIKAKKIRQVYVITW